MSCKSVYVGSVIAACLLAVNSTTAVWSQTRRTGWHSNLKTAAKLAVSTGKPLMVVFRCER